MHPLMDAWPWMPQFKLRLEILASVANISSDAKLKQDLHN
jgi:hypothetical protein